MICKKCLKTFPTYIVIDGRERNLCKRKFCLDCSPFNKHNTSDLCKKDIEQKIKICPKCLLPKSWDEFHWSNSKNGPSPYCKPCTRDETRIRLEKLKVKCVEYKGGKCISCGYNKCMKALHFHHRNPNEKEFNISNLLRKNGWEKIQLELDKCDLLCANCHAEID